MKNLLKILGAISLIGLGSARADLYDNFSSANLNTNKWEVRQDIEGQPLMDEGFVTNGVFHTQQNSIEDKRTYLVPRHQFKSGDTLDYDVNVISGEGNYGNVDILVGGGYDRVAMGMVGYNNGPQTREEFGTTHIRFSFSENNFNIQEFFPSGEIVINNLPLTDPQATYELYIGSFSNGKANIDYDNFYLNGIPAPRFESISIQGGQAVITSSGVDNRPYTLESSTNLTSNAWNPVTNFVGSRTLASPLLDSPTEKYKFYRIKDSFE